MEILKCHLATKCTIVLIYCYQREAASQLRIEALETRVAVTLQQQRKKEEAEEDDAKARDLEMPRSNWPMNSHWISRSRPTRR